MKHPIKIMQIGDGNFIRLFDLAVENYKSLAVSFQSQQQQEENTQTARRTKVTVQSDGTWAKTVRL